MKRKEEEKKKEEAKKKEKKVLGGQGQAAPPQHGQADKYKTEQPRKRSPTTTSSGFSIDMIKGTLPCYSTPKQGKGKVQVDDSEKKGSKWCKSGYSIDYASRFMFPATFVLFAVIYWLIFNIAIK